MGILSSRWLLVMKAIIWRGLMQIGMFFHQIPPPHSHSAAFKISIPSRISSKRGSIGLVFYVPSDYNAANQHRRYPVIVNFHGGGFTLGSGTDDARWARAITDNAHAVMVSVEYRLAPEHPFSVGVEDCADAALYLAAHAAELKLDPHRMALSGFSAGANYALTTPFVIYDLQQNVGRRTLRTDAQLSQSSMRGSASLTDQRGALEGSLGESSEQIGNLSSEAGSIEFRKIDSNVHSKGQSSIPPLTIRAIVSFYPPTDFRITREEKRKTNPQPEKNLPYTLTNLFDQSFLDPEHTTCELDFADPYLSPACASDALLSAAYPETIILYTCEYDMLNAEGVAFGERLKKDPINRKVTGGLIHAVPHAFDRKPNPIKFSTTAERCYSEACAELNQVFGKEEDIANLRQLDRSKNVERFDDGHVGVAGSSKDKQRLQASVDKKRWLDESGGLPQNQDDQVGDHSGTTATAVKRHGHDKIQGEV